jgi:phosphopantothenoylcysteine decarboxylase / phosphopantothenate---cysteine ligase
MSQAILKDKKVLITAGPTKEAIDPVRFISNHSTGKMGYAIAEEFLKQGAEVILISGPVCIQLSHPKLKIINVESANDMYLACCLHLEACDIAVFSAAVADYRPEKVANQKIKKDDSSFIIKLVKNIDIAAEFGKHKTSNQVSVGFALETNDELNHAVGKLKKKNFDMVVLNSMNDPKATFGYDTNKVAIITSAMKQYNYQLKSKKDVARDIVKHVAEVVLSKQSFREYIKVA